MTLPKLFAMNGVTFKAMTDGGADESRRSRNYALARSFAAWLEEKGQLWTSYRAWRDGVKGDPTGERTFLRVTGATL